VTADGGGKMTDKMDHTDDSVEVCDMSVRPTLKITPPLVEKFTTQRFYALW